MKKNIGSHFKELLKVLDNSQITYEYTIGLTMLQSKIEVNIDGYSFERLQMLNQIIAEYSALMRITTNENDRCVAVVTSLYEEIF